MDGSQVRVRFITDIEVYRIADTPFVLPQSLNRAGLSDVVNHLLQTSGEDKVSFDIVINGRLLRSTLSAFIVKYRLSTEDILVLNYFPLLRVRSDENDALELPSWIGCINLLPNNVAIAGCYDGSLRAFDSLNLDMHAEKACHQQPIRCLSSWTHGDAAIIATGSKDTTIKVWAANALDHNLHELAILSGHTNSVEALSIWTSPSTSETPFLLSGDWNGTVLGWSVTFDNDVESTTPAKKKRKNNFALPKLLGDTKPKFHMKAHAQAVSAIIAPVHAHSSVGYTASWDRSIKAWDWERQDCLLTVSCGKVATSLDLAASEQAAGSLLLASSHPDGRIRLWDGRAQESTSTAIMTLGGSGRQNKNIDGTWVAQVKWRPDSLQQLASVDYAGQLSLWDIRAAAPLSCSEIHDGKALAVAWNFEAGAANKTGQCSIISGGSDCMLRSSRVE